jgi:nitrogen regulatory protein PII
MKKIEVVNALRHVEGLTGVTVTLAQGFGRGHLGTEMHPTQEMIHDLHAVAKLDIFCADDCVVSVIRTIQTTSHTGLRGDGKIYVLPVEQAIRISSGEEGSIAI